MTSSRAISGTAFATLLLIALMMGANHVAARIAFNNGVDVATAVVFRSGVTALVLVVLLRLQGVRVRFTRRHRRMLPAIGLLVGIQSLCLYSSVARLPVALALLAFNTYPIWTAFWARRDLPAAPRARPAGRDAGHPAGAGAGAGRAGRRLRAGRRRPMGAHRRRRRFALAAAGTFGLALVHHPARNRRCRRPGAHRHHHEHRRRWWRSRPSAIAGRLSPAHRDAGWWGLATLTFLYGTAFTIMFTVLPKLGVVGNSAIMNVEPVFALVLAWLILGQAIAPVQVAGALIVVGAVMALGMRRH